MAPASQGKYTITKKLRISIYTSMTPFSETQTLIFVRVFVLNPQ